MSKIVEYTAKETKGILLNANENYRDLPGEMKSEIMKRIEMISFNRYPDDEGMEVREKYGKYIGKSASQIMIGNGSDEILGLMISLYAGAGKTLFTLSMDFGMYDYFVSRSGGNIRKFNWELNTPFDTKRFIKEAKGSSMILFSNPNNPTGRVVKKDDILKIVEALPETIVFIDEAYGEFADESVLEYVERYANLFVTKTLSKVFGLANIRLGVLICSEENMSKIAPMKVPYNVNDLSQAAASVVLDHLEYMEANRTYLLKERDVLYKKLAVLDKLEVFESATNFIYATSPKKEEILAALKAKEIVVRNYKDEYFRISIGTKEENELLYETIREVLA